MLKKRVVTASILIPIVLFLLFYASASIVQCSIALLSFLATWEWSRLSGCSTSYSKLIYSIAMIFFALILKKYIFIRFDFLHSFFEGILYLWTLLALCLFAYPHFKFFWEKNWLKGITGFFVITAFAFGLNHIYLLPNGSIYLFLLLLLVWSADLGAYFAGKRFGKNKLAPQISPGKTQEGVLGAIMSVLVITLLEYYYFGNIIQCFWIIALIIVIVSIVGDLFESALKRKQGLKDSGKLFPGHGGILDRIDSLLPSIPVYVILIEYFK